MAIAARQGDPAPADGIESLAERFDADALHVPGGRARVRLAVTGGPAVDAVIAGRRLRLRDADEGADPDCVLSADAATWRRIAADGGGGMAGFRAGRRRVRGAP